MKETQLNKELFLRSNPQKISFSSNTLFIKNQLFIEGRRSRLTTKLLSSNQHIENNQIDQTDYLNRQMFMKIS